MTACIVLAIGVSNIEDEVRNNLFEDGVQPLLGLPKGLYPVGGTPCLTYLWEETLRRGYDRSTYLVADAGSFKAYERWAMRAGFASDRILNTGTTSPDLQGRAYLEALEVVLRAKMSDTKPNGLLIIPADYIYDARDAATLDWESCSSWCCSSGSHYPTSEPTSITSEAYVPSLLKLNGADVVRLLKYLDFRTDLQTPGSPPANEFISLVSYLMNNGSTLSHINGYASCATFAFTDTLSLPSYTQAWKDFYPSHRQPAPIRPPAIPPISKRAYARVGLMGNPSDAFYGKTLSLLISNFYARVTLKPNAQHDASVTFVLNPNTDASRFGSFSVVADVAAKDGYAGASRLFAALSKVFVEHATQCGLALNETGFAVFAETNIPRQVGLAGSSALTTAFLRCLMAHHNLTASDVPLHTQANLVLAAERDELAIAAGHQDRVIQAYGGCVFMDFDQALMEARKYGEYERVDASIWVDLWLAYVAQPKESGKVHNDIRAQFHNGDQEVVGAMRQFAVFASEARQALLTGNRQEFAALMDANFNLRRSLYGDAVIGRANLRMIEVARKYGFAAKFSGSGGAIIGLWKGSDDESGRRERIKQTKMLKHTLQSEGCVFRFLKPQSPDLVFSQCVT
ncbi:galactokinase [Synchytrium endobioticum]|nr:galactokinase [Synchytrium endobioticum]